MWMIWSDPISGNASLLGFLLESLICSRIMRLGERDYSSIFHSAEVMFFLHLLMKQQLLLNVD